jgi:hypothetical protein
MDILVSIALFIVFITVNEKALHYVRKTPYTARRQRVTIYMIIFNATVFGVVYIIAYVH